MKLCDHSPLHRITSLLASGGLGKSLNDSCEGFGVQLVLRANGEEVQQMGEEFRSRGSISKQTRIGGYFFESTQFILLTAATQAFKDLLKGEECEAAVLKGSRDIVRRDFDSEGPAIDLADNVHCHSLDLP